MKHAGANGKRVGWTIAGFFTLGAAVLGTIFGLTSRKDKDSGDNSGKDDTKTQVATAGDQDTTNQDTNFKAITAADPLINGFKDTAEKKGDTKTLEILNKADDWCIAEMYKENNGTSKYVFYSPSTQQWLIGHGYKQSQCRGSKTFGQRYYNEDGSVIQFADNATELLRAASDDYPGEVEIIHKDLNQMAYAFPNLGTTSDQISYTTMISNLIKEEDRYFAYGHVVESKGDQIVGVNAIEVSMNAAPTDERAKLTESSVQKSFTEIINLDMNLEKTNEDGDYIYGLSDKKAFNVTFSSVQIPADVVYTAETTTYLGN
ncbi:MAG: hypothetical protein J6X00_02405 [Clostridia bacterium]|nr:hypothetical protein [Clostridia bacterium]